MRFHAIRTKAKDLEPGDLFSREGPFYWDHYDEHSVGQKVYVRTKSPCPRGQEEDIVYRIVPEVRGESYSQRVHRIARTMGIEMRRAPRD